MREHHNIQSVTDWQLHESGNINNIITFNGQGCSGKTTQAKRLVQAKSCSSTESYTYMLTHALRSDFEKKFYNQLGRKETCITYPKGHCQTLHEVEVLGIPSIAWLTAHFHLRVKPLLLGGSIVVFDHYIGDYYADMLAGANIGNFLSLVRENLAIPDFDQGTHFYLDIDDHEIYKERWRKREEKKHPKNPEKRRKPSVTLCVFKERRERYQKLCELTPLKRINATMRKSEIAKSVLRALEDTQAS